MEVEPPLGVTGPPEEGDSPPKARLEEIAEDGQIEVAFWTKLPPQYKVAEDPFLVPVKLSRTGLSEVVNHLLQRESDSWEPFDFLIDGEFLRVSLRKYLTRKRLTAEVTISVEYTLARQRPETRILDSQPDWISQVTWLPAGAVFNRSCGVTAGMDGVCRLYKEGESGARDLKLLESVKLSSNPLTSCALHRPSADSRTTTVACSDRAGTVYFLATDGESHAALVAGGDGHTAPAQAVTISSDGVVAASGGDDNSIKLWDQLAVSAVADEELAAAAAQKQAESSRKRRAPRQFVPCGAVDDATADSITDLKFSPHNGKQIFAASVDKTVRCFDVTTLAPICVLPVARAANSVDVEATSPFVICTAHDDCHVRVWDVRSSKTANVVSMDTGSTLDESARATLKRPYNVHNRKVAEARWSPFEQNIIASCGLDGVVNLLDIRLPKLPFQTVNVNGLDNALTDTKPEASPYVKLLSVNWAASDTVVSGGSYGKLWVHSLH